MDFNTKTPRASVTIDGIEFTVPQPFTEGHVCTANEAHALNQILVENSRNNFASRIKRAKEKGTAQPTQAELDEYLSGYAFGERRAGGLDAVTAEAVELALVHVKKAITKSGGKISDYKAKDLEAKALEVVGKNPQLLEQAKAIVAQKASIGSQEITL